MDYGNIAHIMPTQCERAMQNIILVFKYIMSIQEKYVY